MICSYIAIDLGSINYVGCQVSNNACAKIIIIIIIIVHWKLCKRFRFEREAKWHDHKPQPVLESEAVKLLCDFTIQTDHRIEYNKPDIVVLDKQSRSCLVIDVACPFDTRVKNKEQEKVENYQDLKQEIGRVWNCHEVKIIPIVTGALGTVPKGLI